MKRLILLFSCATFFGPIYCAEISNSYKSDLEAYDIIKKVLSTNDIQRFNNAMQCLELTQGDNLANKKALNFIMKNIPNFTKKSLIEFTDKKIKEIESKVNTMQLEEPIINSMEKNKKSDEEIQKINQNVNNICRERDNQIHEAIENYFIQKQHQQELDMADDTLLCDKNEICHKEKFTNQKDYLLHIRLDHPGINWRYKCKECYLIKFKKDSIYEHLSSKHAQRIKAEDINNFVEEIYVR